MTPMVQYKVIHRIVVVDETTARFEVGVERTAPGEPTQTHYMERLYVGLYGPLVVDHTEVVLLTFAEFTKRFYIYMINPPYYRKNLVGVVELSVPPYNNLPLPPSGEEQVHEAPMPPPAVILPPPTPTPPIVIPPPVGPPLEEPIFIDPPPDEPEQPVKEVPPTMPPPIVTPPVFIDGPMEPPIRLPPHPGETDRGTILRFAARWGGQIERYAFNVPLDEGEMPEDVEEPFRSMWAKLTQHKADLVFYRKGELYVAEVKPRLSRGAIGEALTAAYMYRRLYNPKERIIPAVICQVAPDILLQVAAHLGVKVFVTDKIDLLNVAGETRFRWQKRL